MKGFLVSVLLAVCIPAAVAGQDNAAARVQLVVQKAVAARAAAPATERNMYAPLLQSGQSMPGEISEDDSRLQNGLPLDFWSYQGGRDERVAFSVTATVPVTVVVVMKRGDGIVELAASDTTPRTSTTAEVKLPLDGEYKDGILPYIVLVVDELADLMLTVQGEIETPLATLAQKARAIGIHLVLATQRPSVNVITGLIKANFPCRIAFRVSAKVDSRTILDQNGAEAMLGNGDMLFLPPGKSELLRVQGAFISTDETERLMDWYKAHAAQAAATAGTSIDAQVTALEEAEKAGEGGSGKGDEGTPGERDALFRQAAEVCIQNQLGSTSLLQRRMSIGYGRAARIIDQLELAGILGPANGSKPRDVLVGLEELDEICGSN